MKEDRKGQNTHLCEKLKIMISSILLYVSFLLFWMNSIEKFFNIKIINFPNSLFYPEYRDNENNFFELPHKIIKYFYIREKLWFFLNKIEFP